MFFRFEKGRGFTSCLVLLNLTILQHDLKLWSDFSFTLPETTFSLSRTSPQISQINFQVT